MRTNIFDFSRAKKKRSKWITLIKQEVTYFNVDKDRWLPTRLESLSDADIESGAYEIYIEVSVVREDNKHGFDSWGWGGSQDKIILFDDGSEIGNKADIEWMKKIVKTTADALNKAGL